MKPRILIFTGDGKGKTTAALGMALRAAGHGLRTRVVQFIKADASTGEIAASRHLPQLEIVQTGLGFVPDPADPRFASHREYARQGLELASETLASGQYDLVILDEICTAILRDLLEEGQVVELLGSCPGAGCLVLTGRGATPGLMALADTVTEMGCVKHGYRSGWPAQKGVEY